MSLTTKDCGCRLHRWQPLRRRFLFVNLALQVQPRGGVNHGIAALTPLLKRRGYEVSLLDLTEPIPAESFRAEVHQRGPAIVGFSCTSHQHQPLQKYSRALRDEPGVLQIAGGVHASLNPQACLRDSGLDSVCVGEGEQPLESLLQAIERNGDVTQAEGFLWRCQLDRAACVQPGFVTDLSALPIPDYSLYPRWFAVRDWDAERSMVVDSREARTSLQVMLSRGCPYNCSYCCNQALRQLYPAGTRYFRLPSVAHSLEVLGHLKREYPEARHIWFLDNLLIADKRWFLEFASEYGRQVALPYHLQGHFEHIDGEIVGALKRSGCTRIGFGLESGDEHLRSSLLHRHHDNDLIRHTVSLVRQAGIAVSTFNMIGLPTETPAQMRATLDLNRQLAPEFGACYFFHPYRGTPLFQFCQEHRLLKREVELDEVTSNFARPLVRMSPGRERYCIWMQKRIRFFFFRQTFKYRCRAYARNQRGWARLGVFLLALRMVATAWRIYRQDYARR